MSKGRGGTDEGAERPDEGSSSTGAASKERNGADEGAKRPDAGSPSTGAASKERDGADEGAEHPDTGSPSTGAASKERNGADEGAVAGGRVAGVVLAAGRSTRMGRSKALLDANGTTFVNRLATALSDGGCEPVLVVLSSPSGPLAQEVARGPGRPVVNPSGTGGQIGSLRVALNHLRTLPEPPQAVAFTPVDNPLVAATTVRRLVQAWRGTGTAIVMPRFGADRGHPVLVGMEIAGEFFAAGLAEGARGVVRRDPSRVLEVAVADSGVVDDFDTPGVYRDRLSEPEPAGQRSRRHSSDGRCPAP